MKKIYGNFLFALAKIIDIFFGGLIFIFETITRFGKSLRGFILPLITLIGCMVFIVPFFFLFLFDERVLSFIGFLILILILPLLGSGLTSALKYYRYVTTEYFYDKADNYRLGKNTKKSFSDYGKDYTWKQEQAFRREQERRRQAENEKWERIFEDFFRQYNSQAGQRNTYGNYRPGGYNTNSGAYNPYYDFSSQYEKACDTLNLGYNTDEYEVKTAYRKLAKKYHPDLNREKGADEKFKKVNKAYEFLTKENIER